MADESELDQALADIEAMGPAPMLVDWAIAARTIWPDMVRVIRAAQALIEDWDNTTDEPITVAVTHVRAIRLALTVER